MRNTRRTTVIAACASLLLFAASQAFVWWPVISHYHVELAHIDDAVLDSHRRIPSDTVLAAVASASMLTDHPLTGDAAVTAADQMLKGLLVLPSLPVVPIDINFAPKDLERGLGVQQLWLASLIVPDLLLRAYEHTQNQIYLDAAQRYIRNFCAFEAREWRPTGLLWNAHATSNRVAVLAHFWRLIRGADNRDPQIATLVHTQAMRLGSLLSKPELFIGTTNHGVMQNVALIQLATAFPELPDSQRYRQTAMARLREQLPFYIAAEGAVLEHSAGYHFHGVVITGYLTRLLQMAGEPVPAELAAAHEAALGFLRDLQRPDRSLPAIGNTYRYAWRLPQLLGQDDAQWSKALQSRTSFAQLYPVSGYAIWADANAATPTQTVVPWGYFAGHGHLRAQEMSVLIWADGTDWSTNSGYWPREDLPGVHASDGWDGGNAPHVLGESVGARQTNLIGYGASNELRLLDLERTVPQGPRVRRQVVQLVGTTLDDAVPRDTTWIVMDTFTDPAQRPLRVLWTAAPESEVIALGTHQYGFRKHSGNVELTIHLQGLGVSERVLQGSRTPFGGWVAQDRKAHPAPSIDARLPAAAAGWMGSVLQLHRTDAPQPLATEAARREVTRVARFAGPEDWDLIVPTGTGQRTVQRKGSTIVIDNGQKNAAPTRVVLEPPTNVAAKHAAIAQAHATIRAKYPRVELYEDERVSVSFVLTGSWIAMIALCWLICRQWQVNSSLRSRISNTAIWCAAHVAWTMGAAWLLFVYLSV